MRFGVVLLVVCSACDLVIPLTEPEPAVCGPYKTVTPVLFDEALAEPSDFSVAYDGIHGMVLARVQLNPTATYTGPVPILFNAESGTWKPDRIDLINQHALTGGHMLGDGTVYGWKDRTSQALPRLDRYRLVGTTWTLITDVTLDGDTSKNFRPGNEIVLSAEGDPLLFSVVIKQDFNGVDRRQIEVRQRFDGDPWGPTGQASKISNFVPHDPIAAVLTADHAKLVYAASEQGNKPRIFASLRNRQEDKYEVGTPVEIDLGGEIDDTEPWIGETCATLYFRRGGITHRAQ